MRVVSERFVFSGDDVWAAYSAAVDAVLDGQLIVFPTDTVYGIACDAFKPEAVQRLLDAKGRGRDMPPPVLISAVESLDALATSVSESGRTLCEAFWPGALTVICHAQTSLMWDLGEVCAWQITVSAPGQNASHSLRPVSLTDVASASRVSTAEISTGGGMSRPRPLASSSRCTASGLNASAAIPYTVSVGNTTS